MTQNRATRRKPQIVAEIGCNHKGDMGTALRMIDVLTGYCCDMFGSVVDPPAIKFQKRDNRTLLTPEEYAAPHPNPHHSYGDTYGEHREALEFDIAEHLALKSACRGRFAKYACSVWDVPSAKAMEAVEADWLKIPSACNLNWDLLETVIDQPGIPIHVSTGMTTYAEIEQIVQFFKDREASDRLVLYACTSGYPVPHDQCGLFELTRMHTRYRHNGLCKAVGYSGHHLGIAIDMAAIALGAQFVERHFTIDRTWKGTDHAASLEPDGMRRLIRDSRAVVDALNTKPDGEYFPIEKPQHEKLKRLAVGALLNMGVK
jgi:N-acetylneuraminate synthase